MNMRGKGQASLILALLAVVALVVVAASKQGVSAVGTTQSLLAVVERDVSPYVVGDTFIHDFVLTQSDDESLPYTALDGLVQIRLYKAYTIRDSANIRVIEPDPIEVTDEVPAGGSVTIPISYTIPTGAPSGRYLVGTVLFKLPMVYDETTNTFIQGEPTVLDKKAVSFNVAGTVAPPVGAFWIGLLDGIANFFRSLLGVRSLMG